MSRGRPAPPGRQAQERHKPKRRHGTEQKRTRRRHPSLTRASRAPASHSRCPAACRPSPRPRRRRPTGRTLTCGGTARARANERRVGRERKKQRRFVGFILKASRARGVTPGSEPGMPSGALSYPQESSLSSSALSSRRCRRRFATLTAARRRARRHHHQIYLRAAAAVATPPFDRGRTCASRPPKAPKHKGPTQCTARPLDNKRRPRTWL